MAFLSRMHELLKDGSQFVIATHSPILLAYPDATIYVLRRRAAPHEYRDTEHSRVKRDFLKNHGSQAVKEWLGEQTSRERGRRIAKVLVLIRTRS